MGQAWNSYGMSRNQRGRESLSVWWSEFLKLLGRGREALGIKCVGWVPNIKNFVAPGGAGWDALKEKISKCIKSQRIKNEGWRLRTTSRP